MNKNKIKELYNKKKQIENIIIRSEGEKLTYSEKIKNEDVKIYEINKTELNKEENNSKVKPIVRCIFCEKLENQFRRCEKSNSKINDENENNKRKKIKKKSSKIFSK